MEVAGGEVGVVLLLFLLQFVGPIALPLLALGALIF